MRAKWRRWIDQSGFFVVLGLCVAIIIGTAVWTGKTRAREQAAGGAPAQAQGDTVQRLSDVTYLDAGATNAPPPVFTRPVEGALARPFAADEALYFPAAALWQGHLACDYEAPEGTPVRAMLAGCVLACETTGKHGLTLVLRHADGYESAYAGLGEALVAVGDAVAAGQEIARAGSGTLLERGEGLLHVSVTLHGAPLDPETLFPYNDPS